MNTRTARTLLVAVVLFLSFSSSAEAATYYMRADGSAVNKAAATSCDDASTAMSVTTHNSQTFSAGDIINVCGNGGTYSTELTNPSSGTSGSPISYIGTSTPTWSMTSRNWYTNGRDWLVIDGITFNNTSSGYSIQMTTTDNTILRNIISTAPSGIYVQTCTSPTLENITSTASSFDGIRIAGTSAVVTNPTIVSAARYGIFLESINGATVTGGTISNTQFEGIRITNANNSAVTIDGTTLEDVGLNGGATSAGIYYSGASVTGTDLTIDDVTITSAGGLGGIYFTSAPFETNRATVSNVTVTESAFGLRASNLNNIDISDSTFTDNTSDGIFFEGTSNGMVISNVTVGDNGRDGISFGDGVTNGTVKYSEIYGSGQTDTTSNGDGITSHTGSTGFTFHNNLIWGNRNSGFALVSNSGADIYNNTVYFNGDSTSVNMGVRGGFYNSGTGGVFDVKNNIFFGNYPYEIQVENNSVYLASTFDYNQYYHVGNNTVEGNFSDIDAGAISWATYSASNESNSNYGDPKFTNATSDFSLLFSSPAINSGVDVGLTDDYEENPLVGVPDIGAYEYQGIPDLTAPVISSISSGTPDTSGATITWTTDEAATSQVEYGLTTSYGTLTTLDSSLVTSHSVSVSGLSSNTLYHFRVASADTNGNLASSTDQTLTTDSSGGGGSSRRRENQDDTSTATTTTSNASATPYVFIRDLTLESRGEDVRALQLFLIAQEYLANDSATGYFGSLTQAALAAYQASKGIQPAVGYFGSLTRASLAQTSSTAPETSTAVSGGAFVRNLTLGSEGEDVRVLQKFLNSRGFTISTTGAGSSGNESTYFGDLTREALARFQLQQGIEPAVGFFGTITQALVNKLLGTL